MASTAPGKASVSGFTSTIASVWSQAEMPWLTAAATDELEGVVGGGVVDHHDRRHVLPGERIQAAVDVGAAVVGDYDGAGAESGAGPGHLTGRNRYFTNAHSAPNPSFHVIFLPSWNSRPA